MIWRNFNAFAIFNNDFKTQNACLAFYAAKVYARDFVSDFNLRFSLFGVTRRAKAREACAKARRAKKKKSFDFIFFARAFTLSAAKFCPPYSSSFSLFSCSFSNLSASSSSANFAISALANSSQRLLFISSL